MSLEEALRENTAAIIAQTEVGKKQIAIMEAAVEKVNAKAGTGAAAASTAKTSTGKAADTKKADTPATTTAKTAEDARVAVGNWIKGGGKAGEAEYERRKAYIPKLNEKYSVAKLAELKPEQVGPVLEDLAALEAGNDPFESASSGDADLDI